jgi:hypothetical protein
MHYDQTFKGVFGGDSLNAMRRVVAQAQGPILQSSISAKNISDKYSPTYFGQISTQ